MSRSSNSDISLKDNKETLIKLLIVASLVLLAVLYSMPMLMSGGIHKCDDTTFHVGRLVGLSNVWTSPVNFDSFGNNGMMVNIFYPWLTMYPMRVLYRITGKYVLAYKMYYLLLTAVTLLISYFSMHGITKSKAGSYMFAVLYTFSSYRYADVYNRDSLGEAIALTFLPLVLLGIYRVCLGDHRRWGVLAVGMTLIAYSHMLSLLMSAAFVGIIYLLTLAFQDDRAHRFAALVKAACLSLGLSAAMIVPMMEQYIKNDLFTPEGNGDTLTQSAYSLGEIIQFTIGNNPAGRGVGITCAIAMIVAIILLIVRAVVNKGSRDRTDGFALLLILVGLVFFVCTADILPWQSLGDTPVSTIQFVWRLNAYPTLAFAAAFAIAISKTTENASKGAVILLCAAVVAAAGLQFVSLHKQNAEMTGSATIAEEDIAKWPSGNTDYAPYISKEYRDANGKTMEYMFIDGEEVEESPVISGRGTYYTQKMAASDKSRTVDIPVFRFYGQKVRIDGTPGESVMSERGTTELKLPASGAAEIEISYNYTALARAAWLFSMIVLISAIINCYRKLSDK